MPAGSWNLGRLRKVVQKMNLNTSSTIRIRDTSALSNDYFNIKHIPSEFTMGKNLIKFRANSGNLVDGSKIHIEIIDSAGNPIYYEPLNYIEKDGSRVIAVWIYKDLTPPGPCTIYIAGRASRNVSTGENFLHSNNYKAPNFKNFPNVIWSRTISISPEKQNSTEIIFGQDPRVTVRERSVSYQQPINVADVYLVKSGSGNSSESRISIERIPDTSNTTTTNILSNNVAPTRFEGAGSRNSPNRSAGQVSAPLAVPSWNVSDRDSATIIDTSIDEAIFGQAAEASAETVAPAEITSVGYGFSTGESRLRLAGSAFAPLSASMEGGYFKLVSPLVVPEAGTALESSNTTIIPYEKHGNNTISGLASVGIAKTLSGSYIFRVNKVESTTTARVSQIEGIGHQAGTEGAFGFPTIKSTNNTQASSTTVGAPKPYVIDEIFTCTNFTSSHIEPFVTVNSLQSQSFAEIILSNIEPLTGDVYKVKTQYKAVGQLGDFVDAGDTILEDIEMLEDVTSFENIPSIGMIFNRIGYFTSLADFAKYWSVNGASTGPEVSISPSHTPGTLMSSITLSPDEPYNNINKRFAYIHLKEEYRPKLTTNTYYNLNIDVTNTNTNESSTSMPHLIRSRLDVYISGSAGTINSDNDFLYAYSNNTSINNSELIYPSNSVLADEKGFGVRIGTIELTESEISQGIISFPFTSTKNQKVDVILVLRRGTWSIANVSLLASKESGFSPNYTRINVRVPSEFIRTPMTFKFTYFDYQSAQATVVSEIFPIEFNGDNLYLQGENNLLTGSMFIGNTLSSGIEQAGRNSAFVRSVGYEGYHGVLNGVGQGGFFIYSGSIKLATTNYFTLGFEEFGAAAGDFQGVGFELVDDNDTGHLIFHTNPSVLDIKASAFFIGNTNSQFISGSNGNIEISSSNFHLEPNGDVTIGGDATILGTVTAEDIFTPAQSPLTDGSGLLQTTITSASAFISASGEAGFLGDRTGSYGILFNQSGSTMQVKQGPNGRVIMDTNAQFFDGLNQGRTLYGPAVQCLTPHRKLRLAAAQSDYVPLYADESNPLGILEEDYNAQGGVDDLDLQRGRSIIPSFYFNPQDDYLVIMYNATTMTYHDQDGPLHPVTFNNSGEDADCEDFSPEGSFNTGPNQLSGFAPLLPNFDLQEVFKDVFPFIDDFDDQMDFGLNDDSSPGMNRAAAHLRFILDISDPSVHTNLAVPGTYPEVLSDQPSVFTTGGKTDRRTFMSRTGFGSFPRPFSNEHPEQSSTDSSLGPGDHPENRYPIHNPGIIVINAAGTCDDSGMFTNLQGKNITIRGEIKRGNTAGGNGTIIGCTEIGYFVKDIRVIMCKKIQLEGLIQSFELNTAAGEVFQAIFAFGEYLYTSKYNELGRLLQPIYTYYTGSEDSGINNSSNFDPSNSATYAGNVFLVPGVGCGTSMEYPD